jgi:hypothetical protein
MLHRADYSKGRLLVLTVPDNFTDLYHLPPAVLNVLRQQISGHLGITLEGPAEVALFPYDNRTFVVESFLDEPITVGVVLGPDVAEITGIPSGDILSGTFREAPVFRNRKFGEDACYFELELSPHSFRAFRY